MDISADTLDQDEGKFDPSSIPLRSWEEYE